MKPRPSNSSSQPPFPEHDGAYTYTHRPNACARLYRLLGAPDPFDPLHAFVTSPVLSAPLLAAARLTLALYTLVALVFALVWDAVRLHDANEFFSFFTELSYIGLCAYFWASGVQTLMYVLSGQKRYPLQRWPRALQVLHALLYSTIITFPFIVTIVFWGILNPDSPVQDDSYDIWSAATFHSMNSLFAALEITCTHVQPQPWLHAPLLVVILAGYLGVAYITHATQGFYTYSFLDPHTQGAKLAGYIIGIGVGAVIVFAITRSLCVLRERIARRCGRGLVERDGAGEPLPQEALHDWDMVEV